MFETLSDTPHTWPWLPVKLLSTKPDHQFIRIFISGIEFGDQSNGPGGGSSADGHCPSISDAGLKIGTSERIKALNLDVPPATTARTKNVGRKGRSLHRHRAVSRRSLLLVND